MKIASFSLLFLCSIACTAGALAQEAAKPDTEHAFQCPSNDLNARLKLGAIGSETASVVSMETNGRVVDPTTLRFINSKVAGRAIERIESTCGDDFLDIVILLPQDEKIVATLQGTTLKVQ